MKLKVCGMKYADNIEKVAALRPDFMGFIFYEYSSRYFEGSIPHLPESIKKVGVFVNAPLDYVKQMIKQHTLDLVQLHGNESPDYCKQIDTAQVIKVFSIKDEFDFDILRSYEPVCNYYLFDTKGQLPGGNGFSFDWTVLKNYPSKKPYFLSGGIGPNELVSLRSFLQREESNYCYAIDVNSKFEIEPGLKKIDELEKFRYELQRK